MDVAGWGEMFPMDPGSADGASIWFQSGAHRVALPGFDEVPLGPDSLADQVLAKWPGINVGDAGGFVVESTGF